MWRRRRRRRHIYVWYVLGKRYHYIVCACSLEHKNHIATFSGFCKQMHICIEQHPVCCVCVCKSDVKRKYVPVHHDVLISAKINIDYLNKYRTLNIIR